MAVPRGWQPWKVSWSKVTHPPMQEPRPGGYLVRSQVHWAEALTQAPHHSWLFQWAGRQGQPTVHPLGLTWTDTPGPLRPPQRGL